MKEHRNLIALATEYTRWCGQGGSYEANLLEALIVRASERLTEVRREIGSATPEESRERICRAIRNPEQWESLYGKEPALSDV